MYRVFFDLYGGPAVAVLMVDPLPEAGGYLDAYDQHYEPSDLFPTYEGAIYAALGRLRRDIEAQLERYDVLSELVVSHSSGS